MSNDIFIGIDGGGSKSKVRIEDREGHLLGQAMGGPANIRLSVSDAWHSIYAALEEALKPQEISLNNKNYHFHIGLGLAGCEIGDAVQAFLNTSHPFTTLQLTSDAHIACLGAHQGADGAIIIVGTGVVGYQVEAGQGSQVSGWGFPHDDEGGGAWLGLEAARLTFHWLDRRTEKSPLVENIFAYFNQDLEKFVTWANRATSTEFARLAPLVINHSQQGERVAVHLMTKAAHAIDRIFHTLRNRRSQNSSLPCCLLGGIAPFIEPWLSAESKSALSMQSDDATAGAILMIRERVKKDRQ